MRRWSPAMLVLVAALSLGAGTKNLESAERDHFQALKVWMSDKQQKLYLKGKTREERDTFLKELGFWDRFYQYNDARRAQIVSGDVQIGFLQDQVYMAWGNPFKKKRLTGRHATRSELLIFLFEVSADGSVMVWEPDSKATHKAVDKFQVELYIDDNSVVEIKRKEDWE